MEEEENKERIKEKGNIHSENYGITISIKDDSGACLVKTPPGPHIRDVHGPSTINRGKGGSGPVGASTGGREYEFEDNQELALALRVSREEQGSAIGQGKGGSRAGITRAGVNGYKIELATALRESMEE